jgi:diguanylate cyclase (GGDEF)-like protein
MSSEPARRDSRDRVEQDADAQTLADLDHTFADGDQTAADLDQTAADSDQVSSNRDQIASDRDQDASDHDHALRVADQDDTDPGYERSRRERTRSTIARNQATQTRSETARARDEAAARRDRMAAERDGAARARDELAASLDAEIERLEHDSRLENGSAPVGIQILLRAAGDRKRAAAARAQAALHREAAARDRELAADDRRQAASDRAEAAEELALEGVDPLTGALLRRMGLATIQRELDRTRRTGERLLVAFVDVDGLKRVNDARGHAAGDELLRAVASSIIRSLRSYDVIVRVGGDEFVCSLSAEDEVAVRSRFDEIAAHLGAGMEGATFTVGFAERLPDDSLDELIARADAAMIEAGKKH